ncbi:AraC family transcriptional regulator [Bacillus sp. WMMC1349]|uniref:AraC family transcriptional regulator n=1 Tax=Bacillus sp. WMMC1349 TaxID=2736254 RepID=UPI001557B28F|nr:AraC family transcriptional regulator [Bacillus sp. WMMC1349]NPC91584.1 AraC family transcriptional regulator [Bacillus sp. WMMC1349]
MEWLTKLSKSIEYIEENLTGQISYDEAAKIACCSTYYFQRMFSYVAGVPLSKYIRDRRMTQAAFDIQTHNSKITDIGFKYGYTSPTAFNRAFQNVHGISPTAARTQGAPLKAYLPIRFKVSVTGDESMRYRIEEKEAFRIVGVRIPLSEDMEENSQTVPIFWEKLWRDHRISEITNLSEQEHQKLLGVNIYSHPHYIFYYVAVATNKPLPKGMEEFEIPSATWVVLQCDGHYPQSIQYMYKRFLTEWLPFSGYQYAELPDIEVYPVSDQKPTGGHSEIWIAIKKQ